MEKNICQSSSNWGFMQDLTSWSFNEHENSEESAQNYMGVPCQWSQGSWDHSHQDFTLRREGLKSCSGHKVPCSIKHLYRPVWSLQWFRGELGESGVVRWDQIQLFGINSTHRVGGGGILPMTPKTPSPLSSMEVETLFFGGVFLLRGQDNCTASKGTVDSVPFFSFFNDFFRSLMTWRRSTKRSGIKCLLRCEQTWRPTTRKVWPLWLPTRLLPPSTMLILISLIKMQINL